MSEFHVPWSLGCTMANEHIAHLEAEVASLTLQRDAQYEMATQYIAKHGKAELENERLDRLLREACRMWALCCDDSVMHPPRVRNAGEALEWLKRKEIQP